MINEAFIFSNKEDAEDSFSHYGMLKQKWGQRRYQNPDGTYTELGKESRHADNATDKDEHSGRYPWGKKAKGTDEVYERAKKSLGFDTLTLYNGQKVSISGKKPENPSEFSKHIQSIDTKNKDLITSSVKSKSLSLPEDMSAMSPKELKKKMKLDVVHTYPESGATDCEYLIDGIDDSYFIVKNDNKGNPGRLLQVDKASRPLYSILRGK